MLLLLLQFKIVKDGVRQVRLLLLLAGYRHLSLYGVPRFHLVSIFFGFIPFLLSFGELCVTLISEKSATVNQTTHPPPHKRPLWPNVPKRGPRAKSFSASVDFLKGRLYISIGEEGI